MGVTYLEDTRGATLELLLDNANCMLQDTTSYRTGFRQSKGNAACQQRFLEHGLHAGSLKDGRRETSWPLGTIRIKRGVLERFIYHLLIQTFRGRSESKWSINCVGLGARCSRPPSIGPINFLILWHVLFHWWTHKHYIPICKWKKIHVYLCPWKG